MSALQQQWSQQLPSQQDGPQWLNALRERAAAAFADVGLPGARTEAWKYTSLRAIERRQPAIASSAQAHPGPAAVSTPEWAGASVQMVNGAYASSVAARGLSLAALGETFTAENPRWRDMLESLPGQSAADAFSLVNTAALEHGVVIRVATDAAPATLMVDWQTLADGAERLNNSRVLIVLEKGADLDLVMRLHPAEDGNAASNVVFQVALEAGARLRVSEWQALGADDSLIQRWHVRQAADSYFHHTVLDAGGALVRREVQVLLEGEGAETDLGGAWLVDGRQHVDNRIAVDHLAPNCTSRQLYRGLASGRGRAVWNGRVEVHEGADGSDAQQSNANLLLSPHAEIDTKPELEIHADEVVASHGATVGQMDERALFYLRTRGLSEDAARRILVRAFCGPVVARLAEGPIRDLLAEQLQQRAEALA